jgi:hypothetical protein
MRGGSASPTTGTPHPRSCGPSYLTGRAYGCPILSSLLRPRLAAGRAAPTPLPPGGQPDPHCSGVGPLRWARCPRVIGIPTAMLDPGPRGTAPSIAGRPPVEL